MDHFKAIYAILAALEAAMDCLEFEVLQIGPDVLGVSKERWGRSREMMTDVS